MESRFWISPTKRGRKEAKANPKLTDKPISVSFAKFENLSLVINKTNIHKYYENRIKDLKNSVCHFHRLELASVSPS